MSNVASDKVGAHRRAIHITVQACILTVLTLLVVMAVINIITIILFRRLLIGNAIAGEPEKHSEIRDVTRVILPEFRVSLDKRENPRQLPIAYENIMFSSPIRPERPLNEPVVNFRWPITRALSYVVDRVSPYVYPIFGGRNGEIYIKYVSLRDVTTVGDTLFVCCPSATTVDMLLQRVVDLSTILAYDSVVLFDYRATGRSSRNLYAPSAETMYEDAVAALTWFRMYKDCDMERLTVCGISLGGLQAARLATRSRMGVKKLLLINTFASVACVLGPTAGLVTHANYLGGSAAFVPDLRSELRGLSGCRKIGIVSVKDDNRIPEQCTQELVDCLKEARGVEKLIHIVIGGTHSDPEIGNEQLTVLHDLFELRNN